MVSIELVKNLLYGGMAVVLIAIIALILFITFSKVNLDKGKGKWKQ